MAPDYSPTVPLPRDSRRATHRLLWTSVLSALLLVLLWFAEDVIGESTRLTTLLLYVPQHPFGLLPALLLWRAYKKRLLWPGIINVLALGGLVFWHLGFNLPLGRLASHPAGATQPIRLMTYNTRFSGLGPARVAQTIQLQNPDIVCMQETTPDLMNTSQSGNDKTHETLQHLPGWTLIRDGDVATITKWKVLSHRSHQMPPPTKRILLETQIQTPSGVLTVFNVHIGTAARGVKPSTTYSGRVNNIIRNSRASARTRLDQLPIIDQALARCETPFIMAGDFNNPPRGHFYRHLASQLTDAFAHSGWGFGHTFPSRVPLLRIDYIWLGPGITAQNAFVPRVYSSDHRPMVADVMMVGKKTTRP